MEGVAKDHSQGTRVTTRESLSRKNRKGRPVPVRGLLPQSLEPGRICLTSSSQWAFNDPAKPKPLSAPAFFFRHSLLSSVPYTCPFSRTRFLTVSSVAGHVGSSNRCPNDPASGALGSPMFLCKGVYTEGMARDRGIPYTYEG